MINNTKPVNESILELLGDTEVPPQANLQLLDPFYLEYYKDLDTRKIFITSDIDESVILDARNILRWNAEDEKAGIPVEERKKIIVYILSYGGALDVCMMISDIMKMSKTPIVTINLGVAASAACVILMSGTPGYRYCLKHSWGLIHQGSSSGGSGGSYAEIQAQSQNYKKLIEMLKEIILDRTKIDTKTYNKYKSKEWYVYSEDMINYGIVDKVVDSIDEII